MRSPLKRENSDEHRQALSKKTEKKAQPKAKAEFLKKQPLQTIQEAHKTKEADSERPDLFGHLNFLQVAPPQLNYSRTPQSRSTYKTDQKQDAYDQDKAHEFSQS